MEAPELQRHYLPDFELQSGIVLPELVIAYRCYGCLNQDASNVVVFPTYYTGTDSSNARLIGTGRALDPDNYFIIVPNLCGNGVSSSPSNTAAPFDGPRFPLVTVYDNVRAQKKLLEHLGIEYVALVLGWSMGGMQSYQWCAQYPDCVSNALVICATARTSAHNKVFLDGVSAALLADQHFNGGDYLSSPVAGLKAFARVYVGWAYSQAFFRNGRFRELGFSTVDDLIGDWEDDHLSWDANNLLAMLATWRAGDISQQWPFENCLGDALAAIKARVHLMPCEEDLYFRYEDTLQELEFLSKGKDCRYRSEFGHCSAGPGRVAEVTVLVEEQVRLLLSGV